MKIEKQRLKSYVRQIECSRPLDMGTCIREYVYQKQNEGRNGSAYGRSAIPDRVRVNDIKLAAERLLRSLRAAHAFYKIGSKWGKKRLVECQAHWSR